MPSSRPHPELKSCQSHAHLLPQQLLLSKRCISLCFPSWVIITRQKYSTYLSQNIWWEQKKKKEQEQACESHTQALFFSIYGKYFFVVALSNLVTVGENICCWDPTPCLWSWQQHTKGFIITECKKLWLTLRWDTRHGIVGAKISAAARESETWTAPVRYILIFGLNTNN